MLTRDEYERHFKSHLQDLVIRQSNEFYIISSKEGRICPHSQTSGCQIYHDRPIDCRLYPYVMSRFIKKIRKVKIIFHTRSDCPVKDPLFLLMPKTKARSLIIEFGKKVYGGNKTIIVQHDQGMISQFLIRIDAAISRRMNKIMQIIQK